MMAGTAAGHRPRPRAPDLVVDSEMETSKCGRGCVQHTFLEPPTTPGDRFRKVKQTWYRKSSNIVPCRVFLDEDAHSQKVRAVKVLDSYSHIDYYGELEALAKFSGPKYAHCFVNSDGWYKLDDEIFVSMEYLQLGNLGMHLANPLPEVKARDIVQQLLEGLAHMHKAGFVHRNLTPENIMVAAIEPRWIVKIGGFGCVARDPVDVRIGCSRSKLSQEYSAPELLRLTEAQADVPYAADMWSLGAITFRLVTDATPFKDEESSTHLGGYLKRGRGDMQTWKLYKYDVSEPGRDFITDLMVPDAGRRPTAAKAADHQWFKTLLPSPRIGGHVTPPQTPSPARAATPRRSHTPNPVPNLTPDRYNEGERGFTRPLFEYRHSGETGEEWVGRAVNPFPPSQAAQPRQFPSTPPRPGLNRWSSSKRKLSREPDEHPPSLQKRPSLKKSDGDDFATNMSITEISTSATPTPSATGRQAGYETCSETLIGRESCSSPRQPPRNSPLAELLAIQRRLETEVQPRCAAFGGTTQEHAQLVHALEKLLTDVDGVQGRGQDQAAGALGKQLVRRVQEELRRLDEAFNSGGRRWWDCISCGSQVRFGKGTRDRTYEVDSGDRTNMVVVTDPLYFCRCGKACVCLKCGIVEAEVCKCYTRGDLRKRQGQGRA
ncbi:hypothetical protein MCOR07_011014 [Pyricularia oryzae]|nr:hypothetical protein MCOR29_004211 [Pyricularia oryzae]KAI6386713.1 hypothetical protein MCOR32_000778 [Pyricularia oryzae]KAI6424825.1 hypothetical protein MCOR21_007555 [Pyricularia oryzae]KAI6455371.1 hypothetical protein MCOR15_007768 [Pyricularia oryzae]KAI6514859.1 hypothetical protein MCOR16_010384 [Pyricularia oryzae]